MPFHFGQARRLVTQLPEVQEPTDNVYTNFFCCITGAVAAVEGIANPVSLARHVMEDTPHCLLAGEGAVKFAKKIGFPVLEDPLVLITEESHERSLNVKTYFDVVPKYVGTSDAVLSDKEGSVENKPCYDTVGAVAVDAQGKLACATSTG